MLSDRGEAVALKERILDRLKDFPDERILTVGAVRTFVSGLEESGASGPGRPVAPSGPGKCEFPCPCGTGQLAVLAVTGLEKRTGDYVRYRLCNTCGRKFTTREVVRTELMKGDNRRTRIRPDDRQEALPMGEAHEKHETHEREDV